jgi:hypothetical protein
MGSLKLGKSRSASGITEEMLKDLLELTAVYLSDRLANRSILKPAEAKDRAVLGLCLFADVHQKTFEEMKEFFETVLDEGNTVLRSKLADHNNTETEIVLNPKLQVAYWNFVKPEKSSAGFKQPVASKPQKRFKVQFGEVQTMCELFVKQCEEQFFGKFMKCSKCGKYFFVTADIVASPKGNIKRCPACYQEGWAEANEQEAQVLLYDILGTFGAFYRERQKTTDPILVGLGRAINSDAKSDKTYLYQDLMLILRNSAYKKNPIELFSLLSNMSKEDSTVRRIIDELFSSELGPLPESTEFRWNSRKMPGTFKLPATADKATLLEDIRQLAWLYGHGRAPKAGKCCVCGKIFILPENEDKSFVKNSADTKCADCAKIVVAQKDVTVHIDDSSSVTIGDCLGDNIKNIKEVFGMGEGTAS